MSPDPTAGRPAGPPAPADDLPPHLKRVVVGVVALVALLWAVELVDTVADDRLTTAGGIVAREPSSVPDVVTAPFLHTSWAHVQANSGPLLLFGLLAAYRDLRRFLLSTALVVACSGLAAWLLSPSGTITVGASGVVYGWFGYVVARGLVDRRPWEIALALVVFASFAYLLLGVLPATTSASVSWQGHLGGLVGGVVGAVAFRPRQPRPAEA